MANETKWTPAPWRVDAEPTDSIVTSGFKTALKAAEIPAIMVQTFGTVFALGVDIAAVPSYGGEHVARANAALIAAAPDLYEALVSLLNVEGAALSAAHSLPAFKGLLVAYHFDKARAALAKAQGE